MARRDGGRHTGVTAANSASKSLAWQLHQQRLPMAVVVVVFAVVIVIVGITIIIVVLVVVVDSPEEVFEGPLRDAAALPASGRIGKPEVDALVDPDVDHVPRRVREAGAMGVPRQNSCGTRPNSCREEARLTRTIGGKSRDTHQRPG